MIGLISDTHGLLRPEALAALRGAELIVHAGDVGKMEILDRLKSAAPVVAVRGNVDDDDSLPVSAVVEAEGTRIYVIHNLADLDFDPAAAGFGIVVSGHSHKPSREEKGGVLYVNPGAAGPRRFNLPVMVARLQFRESRGRVEFVDLTKPLA